VFEIANSPADLGEFVSVTCQGHYDVVIHLRDGVAMASVRFQAPAVGVQDRLVNPRIVSFDPVYEGGTEVEAEIPVIVHQIEDSILVVDKARGGVGPIAFKFNALVPVVIRGR